MYFVNGRYVKFTPVSLKGSKLDDTFFVHSGYPETCQRYASPHLRSLSFLWSLSTLPTPERQLCVGKLSPFSTGTRAYEKANLPATPF